MSALNVNLRSSGSGSGSNVQHNLGYIKMGSGRICFVFVLSSCS